MNSLLRATLGHLIAHAPKRRTDWWVIGSAALDIMGVEVEARDVDLLTTHEGGLAWLKSLGVAPDAKTGEDMFRSRVFKSLKIEGGLELEVMGHLEVETGTEWHLLTPRTRQAVSTPAGVVYVPAPEEMLDILLMFGRPKDMDRAQKLRDLMASQG